MTIAGGNEVSGMKREETLLNLLCLATAGGFLALVLYNLFAAGSIITTDGLFMIVVPMVLALPFLLVPLGKVVSCSIKGSVHAACLSTNQSPACHSAAAANIRAVFPPSGLMSITPGTLAFRR